MRKLTQIEFIKKCILKYGNKYDYSKVKYINSKVKVCIICHEKDEFGEEHGEFWQRPNDHLNGCGCPKCNDKYIPTTEEWIKKAKQVHGDKYDYSKTVYINSQTKVCIICPKHGEFWQKANGHLNGLGCLKCSGLENLTTEIFKDKANIIHNNKYDYSMVNYYNHATKVCIICHEKDEFGEEHGEFWQRPNHHLKGVGCKKCSKNYMDNNLFIKKAKQVHGDKYDYSKTVYINSQTNICIICPEHGEFWQLPSTHLKGSGCPLCVGTHGEQYIMEFLNKNNIQFEFQKTFKWLKYRKNLYLDFYLPELKCCIEFQGEQHYKPINFGSKNKKELLSEFKLIQKRDIVKEKLCRENNIRIFYIKYDELFNIENIINNIIKECNQ